jgi:multidrug efflux pump subunit AcrB
MIREKGAKEIAKIAEEIALPFKSQKDELGSLLFEDLNVIVPQTGIIKSDVEIAFSSDKQNIQKAVEHIESKMREIDGVSNINNDLFVGEMELKLRVNGYGQSIGLNENYIFNQLRAFYLKGEISKMFNDSGILKVKTQSYMREFRESILDFNLNLPNGSGVVKLTDVAEFIYKPAFAKIIKENGERVRTIYATLDKKIITSSELLEKLANDLNIVREYSKVIIKGEQKESEKVQKEITEAGIIALFLIFISLVWMFDSILKPLMIISTIPLTILGVLIGHQIMQMNLTLPSLIGLIGLAGVVVNDGLIMIDFIRKGKTKSEILDRAKLRLRPILLTSMTTIIGLSTLIFFPTGQSLILQPMAVTIGFGLVWATVLNLYYIPILYSVIYRIKD